MRGARVSTAAFTALITDLNAAPILSLGPQKNPGNYYGRVNRGIRKPPRRDFKGTLKSLQRKSGDAALPICA